MANRVLNMNRIGKMGLALAVFVIVFSAFPALGVQGSPSSAPSALKEGLSGLFSSFAANFTYNNSQGAFYEGKIYYQYPNKLHIELKNKKVIATNGLYLWIYNPETLVCIRQTVEAGDLGILDDLDRFVKDEVQNRYVYEKTYSSGEMEKKVVIDVENGMIQAIQIQEGKDVINISFSNIETDIGIKASLFNYKPPTDTQLLENPLNKLAKE